MRNSLSICQWYVAKVFSSVHVQYPNSLILHYMDDILVAAKDQASMQETTNQVISAVEKAGLTIVKEKIQTLPPWKYLGYRITEQTVTPQPLQLKGNSKALNEAQQLVGTLNCLHPLLGISNQDLAPLSDLLKGDTALNSPREFNKEAQNALDKVM